MLLLLRLFLKYSFLLFFFPAIIRSGQVMILEIDCYVFNSTNNKFLALNMFPAHRQHC